MENKNHIIVIDDDEDDIFLIKDVAFSLGIPNELLTFTDARHALRHFRETKTEPFFILCDVNMPAMDGFELREKIIGDNIPRLRSTPFIFLTTSKQMCSVSRAYGLGIQGYFTKPKTFSDFIDLFKSILSYWGSVPMEPGTP